MSETKGPWIDVRNEIFDALFSRLVNQQAVAGISFFDGTAGLAQEGVEKSLLGCFSAVEGELGDEVARRRMD